MDVRIRLGSRDSMDEDNLYLVDTIPSFEECKTLCDNRSDNGNLAVVREGVVVDSYKGLPDEVNNSLFHTYALHEQDFPCPVASR